MTESLAEGLGRIFDRRTKPSKSIQDWMNHLRETRYDPEDSLQLLAFMIAHAPEAKGGLFQDLWALWVSGQKMGGYFVEFGAGDGVFLSNTWLLETKMGWRGLLAEPNPAFLPSLKANRRCAISTRCVYSRTGERLEFLAASAGELSRIASIEPADGHEEKRRKAATYFEVETISLNDLLAENDVPRIVDYMSVDTEGSEIEILSTFDFDRWDVRAISVEHNHTAARDQLYALLTARGYRRELTELSRYDDWYVKAL